MKIIKHYLWKSLPIYKKIFSLTFKQDRLVVDLMSRGPMLHNLGAVIIKKQLLSIPYDMIGGKLVGYFCGRMMMDQRSNSAVYV